MRARSRWGLLLTAAIAAAGLGLGPWSGRAAARAPDGEPPGSLAGSYLAGRFARGQHETAEAASFYRDALVRDPESEVLLEQAFLMEASEGDWARAAELASELAAKDGANRMARVFLGLSAYKEGRFTEADKHFTASASSPIGELTSVLARAWIKLATGDPQGGLDLLEVPKQAEWAREYIRFHRALAADVAGRRPEARAAFEQVFRHDGRSMRTALAYARHLANAGDFKLAKTVLRLHVERTENEAHPLVKALDGELRAGAKTAFLAPSATTGLAEIFYGLGEALTGEGGVSIGLLYLRMALYLEPDHPFALVALAQALETAKRFSDANAVYDRVPKTSALQPNISVQKAVNLSLRDQVDEAQALLERESAKAPADLTPLDALANMMRTRKRFAEAVDYYTRAITIIGEPEKRHWAYYYFRGTCYERMKDWPRAEADLRRALRLAPEQPLVLNYLGYSWIDQNKNLKQGLAYIEKAVALKPDDGYVVDSLGWAHYKLGDYKEAVRHLERAVELRPDDPVLNDHLGDALWRVGREREARFQWDQALILKPEPEEVEKIKRKIESGLVAAVKPVARKPARQVKRGDFGKRRETKLSPPRPLLE